MSPIEFHLLDTQYSTPNRVYHGLGHIQYIFDKATELEIRLTEVEKLAIWWHDAAYRSGELDNEEISVQLMLSFSYDKQLAQEAAPYIMSTKIYDPNLPTNNVRNLDWLILAEKSPTYNRYSEKVWQEFSYFDHTRQAFVEGRMSWIEQTLQTKIFTDRFMQFEDAARANLEREYKKLKRERKKVK